jgi:hypothetical protein
MAVADIDGARHTLLPLISAIGKSAASSRIDCL